MDPESSASDIQAFYSQASFYRRNQQEKKFVEQELGDRVEEKRKRCKELANQITDPYDQEPRLTLELNKERQSLATLYVKQIILNSEEAPFTAFYSSHIYNEEPVKQCVEEAAREQFIEKESTEHFVGEIPAEQSIEEKFLEQPVEDISVAHSVIEESVEHFDEEELIEYLDEKEFTEHFDEEVTRKQLVEDPIEQSVNNVLTEQFSEEKLVGQSVEEESTEQTFKEETAEQFVGKVSVEQSGEEFFEEQFGEEEPIEQFEEIQNDTEFIKMSVSSSSLESKSSCSSNSFPSPVTGNVSNLYGEAPPTYHSDLDSSQTTVTQHFVDTADSIIKSAFEEHSRDHISSNSTLKRTLEMESLYEPEEPKDSHIHIKEEQRFSSIPNFQSLYNDAVGGSGHHGEERYETQELAYKLPAEKLENETSKWHYTHVSRPIRTTVDTVSPDHKTGESLQTYSTWRHVHVNSPESSFPSDSERYQTLHRANDIETQNHHSTWQQVHVNQPVRISREHSNPEHEQEVDGRNTQVIAEQDFPEPEDHKKTPQKYEKLEHNVWYKTHVSQPYRPAIPRVDPIEESKHSASEVHSTWRDVHVQRANDSFHSSSGNHLQKHTSPSYHRLVLESEKPVSPSEWKEAEPIVLSSSSTSFHKFHQSYQPEWNSEDSHESDLPPNAEAELKSELSIWLSSRKSQEEQETKNHQSIQEESKSKSVASENPVRNEDPEEEWVHEEEETVYSTIPADEANNLFNTWHHAHVSQPRSFGDYLSHHQSVRQGFGYDKFKEIERETAQEENLQNKPAIRYSTDNQWKSSDSHWNQTYEEKTERYHTPRQIEIQSPHLSSEAYHSTQEEIPGIVLSTPPNEPPGSDEEFELIPHGYQVTQHPHSHQEDESIEIHDIQESTVTSHDSTIGKIENEKHAQVDVDTTIKTSQETHVDRGPAVYQSGHTYSEKYRETPTRPTRIIDQYAESSTHRSPERIFNRYEDDIVVEHQESGPNQKIKIVYGSGYDYFKEIEKTTLKEDGIGSGATVRSSTDRGWQTPDSDTNLSPLLPYNSPSPTERNKQWEPTPERRIPTPDYVYVPVRISRSPSPAKEESDHVLRRELEEVSRPQPKTVESHHYSSSNESRKIEFKRSQFVDSPAFEPTPSEEEPKILTPTKVQKSVRFHESTFEPKETTKVNTPISVPHAPVHSKVFNITEKPQLPERVRVTGWESSTQQEEETIKKDSQHSVNFVPRNRELIFDESIPIDQDHELFKAKTFREEREKAFENYEDEWKKHVNVTEVRKSSGKVDFEGSALPNRRYEVSESRRDEYADETQSQLRKVHARNEKVPSWRVSRESESTDGQGYPHHADIADIDVHAQIMEEKLARQRKLEERQNYKITKNTGTTSSSYSSDDSEQIRRAVTEAAKKHVISVKIPKSPVTMTPPSTPVTTEPPGSGPLPKLSRSVYKSLEKTITEEELQRQGKSREYERAVMEEKKRIAEKSLRYPGRKQKHTQDNLFTDASQTEMEDRRAGRKYFIDEVPRPRAVNFAPRPAKFSSDQLRNEEVSGNEISKKETVSASSENFAVQRASEHSTATASRRRDPTPIKVEEDVEDFRQSRTFVQYKEGSKEREELAWKVVDSRKEQVEYKETEREVTRPQPQVPTPKPRYQRPPPKPEPVVVEPKFIFKYLQQPSINSVTKKYGLMPELEDGIPDSLANGMLKQEESDVTKNWDPTELLNALYKVDYKPRIEQKRSKFRNMEGHLEIPNDEITVPEVEKEWKKVYFRTKDSRLQWFASKYADEHPIGDIYLCDAEIIPNRENFTITVITKAEPKQTKLVVRVPSHLFEKWRQSLLSHRDSNVVDSYVQPFTPPIPHFTDKIVLVELGSCSIRAGILTNKPSLPQSFFPALGCIKDNGEIAVGSDALRLEVRHRGQLARPIDVADNSIERYKLNKEVLNACLDKVIRDLEIRPENYTVLLSIPQNIPSIFTSELLNTLLSGHGFKAASIARQPSLILYSYDVTTGIVVDIGERLNVVPVIDEYIVENAIVSLPFGAQQIRDSLRQNLKQRNNGLYSYQSPVEHTLLRYIVEQACYVAAYSEDDEHEPSKTVDLDGFRLAQGMESKITIDESRFHATEGLFVPKKWSLEIKGLHQLIHNAIQLSPIDSRRTLYKNIYLSGGTSLLHGMAERIENEISKLVPGNIQVKVHMSPWRYHAAYLGAQVIASGKLFGKCCATKENLSEYLKMLEISAYANGN